MSLPKGLNAAELSVAGLTDTVGGGFGLVRNAGTTLHVFYRGQITNFDVPLL